MFPAVKMISCFYKLRIDLVFYDLYLINNEKKNSFRKGTGYYEILYRHANIAQVTSVENLGTWFKENGIMVTHINKLCKAASFHLYDIRRIRKYLTSEAMHSAPCSCKWVA